VLGLGLGLPDPKAPKRRGAKPPPPQRGACASEALEKLTRETREAVRGLETATGGVPSLDDDAMMEEFVKQFEEFAGAQVPIALACLFNGIPTAPWQAQLLNSCFIQNNII
jgi:peroxin-19